MKTMYITNDPQVALIAEKYGVDRIWIDLETLGKEERQKNMNSVKSNHTIKDIHKIRKILTKSELLVRVNPINENSKYEIEQVIDAGADIIMLPMWKNTNEVTQFINIINKRTKTTLLLETREAVECIDDILELDGIDEIHIGLNDLHLSYKLDFMFEPLINGIVEELCEKFNKKNIPYGFGGVAQIGAGLLPAEKILIEHKRLGSTRVILSRSFCNTQEIKDKEKIEKIFKDNMIKFNKYWDFLDNVSKLDYKKNRDNIIEIIDLIKKRKKKKERKKKYMN